MREGAESTYTREGGEAVDQSGGKARHYEHLGPIFCAFSTKYLKDKTNQKSSQNIPVLTNVVLVREEEIWTYDYGGQKRVSHLWKPTAVEPIYEHAIGISNLTPSKLLFRVSRWAKHKNMPPGTQFR